MTAALFALLAAALFGGGVHLQREALRTVDAMPGALVGCAAAALLFALAAPFEVRAEWWLMPATALFALCGVFMPALSMTLAIVSVQRAGPALTSALGSFAPFFAVVPAVFLLGEPFGVQAAAGLALMTGGLALAPFAGPAGAAGAVPDPNARRALLLALLLPLGAAALRGLAQPITKIGLAEVPSPLFASLVGALVSTVALLAVRPRALTAALRGGPGVAWFAGAGVVNGLGILSLNAALGSGDVIVAASLVATAPLWTLFFGALLPDGEAPSRARLGVAVLAAAGAALILSR